MFNNKCVSTNIRHPRSYTSRIIDYYNLKQGTTFSTSMSPLMGDDPYCFVTLKNQTKGTRDLSFEAVFFIIIQNLKQYFKDFRTSSAAADLEYLL